MASQPQRHPPGLEPAGPKSLLVGRTAGLVSCKMLWLGRSVYEIIKRHKSDGVVREYAPQSHKKECGRGSHDKVVPYGVAAIYYTSATLADPRGGKNRAPNISKSKTKIKSEEHRLGHLEPNRFAHSAESGLLSQEHWQHRRQ